ncbi:MAG: type VI secretion system-associated FHA domain protein TagH [Phenylobacterium sp.]
MTLVLTINGLDRLDNGEAARLKLDRHGARIGRSPHMDWSLPDPRSYISSTHCEIEYRDGGYTLIDRSTNGTYVNGAAARLPGPHRIADGDVILVGHYEIVARLEGEGGAAASGAAPEPAWGGWDSHVPASPVGVDPAKWDRPAPQAAISGLGSASSSWAAPRVETPEPQPSAWAQPEAPALQPSSWSSEPQAEAAPSAADVWGQLASTNAVDWARSGFGAPPPAPLAAVPGPAPAFTAPPSAAPAAAPASSWGAPAPPSPAAPASVGGAFGAPGGGEWAAFLSGAGLQPSDVKGMPAEAMATAGMLMKRLIGGMVVMLEARARAKAQLGAQNTSLEFDGNNPLKFARTADKALAQLLSPPERGFMGPERAVEDSFRDLQAHQLATLSAMQGALAATLARFSPTAIRGRAETRGLLAKILPSAREATLWQAYEREFEGVAKGSDEAFMDVFAKEFRAAYERVAAEMKAKV